MKRPMGNGYPPGPRRPMKKKMTIDSDSEYDSEMDDFIDDSPMDGEPDISSVLRDVFGYDKRK
jgi:protein SPT2